MLLAAAGLTKPTALVIAPGFIVAVLFDTPPDRGARWRSAVTLGVGIALAAAVQIGWNLVRFGRPLDFGYNLAGMIPILPARSFAPEDVPRGLLVQLLTPGKSLFVWAPVTLVSVLTIRDWWSRERGIGGRSSDGNSPRRDVLCGISLSGGRLRAWTAASAAARPAADVAARHAWRRVPRRALAIATVAGFIIAALAASVSFLEDQSPPQAGPQASRSVLRADRSAARTAVEPVPDRLHPVQDGAHERALVVGGSTGWQRARYLRAASRAGTGVDAWRLRDSCLAPWAVSLPWLTLFILEARRIFRRQPSR